MQILIGGLHKSGGDIIYNILKGHPEIAGFIADDNNNSNDEYDDDETKAESASTINKDESRTSTTRSAKLPGYTATPVDCQGQLRQKVYPPDGFHGGPGCWAFDPSSHVTEDSWLASDKNAAQILQHWSSHRDTSSSTTWEVEYSPSNMLKTRFLDKLFPNSHHIMVIRHPLAYAYAIENELKATTCCLVDLVRHWLHAHFLWRQDCQNLGSFQVVFYEELIRDPHKVTAAILDRLNLSRDIGGDSVNLADHLPTEQEFDDLVALDSTNLQAFESMIKHFGYSLGSSTLQVGLLSIGRSIVFGPIPEEAFDLVPEDFRALLPVLPASPKLPSTPKRILFYSLGTRGDIQPLAVLASLMQKQGYSTWIVSSSEHQEFVESFGLQFCSFGFSHAAMHAAVCCTSAARGQDVIDPSFMGLYYEDTRHIIPQLVQICLAKRIECLVQLTAVPLNDVVIKQLNIPIVALEACPRAYSGSGFHEYCRLLLKMRSYSANYGCNDVIEQVYQENEIPLNPTDNFSLAHVPRILNLGIYSKAVHAKHPVLADFKICGYIYEDIPTDSGLSEELEIFLAPPVCLNFGSMAVYGATKWIEPLLSQLQKSGQRCVSLGVHVPPSVRQWTFWLSSVPHAAIFPRCACVIHHGGAGTTASTLRAGIPSIIVPVFEWADQISWGTWLVNERAGILLNLFDVDSIDDMHVRFESAFQKITHPEYKANVERLRSIIVKENGAETVLAKIEFFFAHPRHFQEMSARAIERIESSPLSVSRKLALASFSLVHSPDKPPRMVEKLQELFTDKMLELYPLYPEFPKHWPPINLSINLPKFDLHQASAGHESWNFEASMSDQSGRHFSALCHFSRLNVRDGDVAHVIVGVFDEKTGKLLSRSIGDASGPERLRQNRMFQPRERTEYLQRTIFESFNARKYPPPTSKSASNAQYAGSEKENRMFVSLEGTTVSADSDGNYRVTCSSDDDFGFDFVFKPVTQPIRNGDDGYICDLNSFGYAVPKLDVSGIVTLKGAEHIATGSGQYSRCIGSSKKDFDKHPNPPVLTSMWIHLADGCVVLLNRKCVSSSSIASEPMELDVRFIYTNGQSMDTSGTLVTGRTWSSLTTFVEFVVSWHLSVPELSLELQIEARCDNQEIISFFAFPSFWCGSVNAEGSRTGAPVTGEGVAREYGRGVHMYSNYKNLFKAVGKETQKEVDRLYPTSPSPEQMKRLFWDDRTFECVQHAGFDRIADELMTPVRMITDRGGKGWRSMCFAACGLAVGGKEEDLRSFLAFPELTHTGSLIVDDVQDNSDLRRGGPACHVVHGVATAINAGTAAYFAPEVLIWECDVSPETRLELYRLCFLVLRTAHAGQGMDIRGLADAGLPSFW
mmetsp:Transcript_26471/g.44195  ORF Transcript_26471/g.44195 Transcript_26471/m.44195 type:complete len:1365 (-) Transcript_26471:805-4899(-)